MAIYKIGWVLVLSLLVTATVDVDAAKKFRYRSFDKNIAKFSAHLYSELASQNGNILISPISVQTILGLVQMGARGVTLQQMSKVLGLPQSPLKVAKVFQSLKATNENITDVVLDAVNKIFVRDDIELLEGYRNLTRYFDADIAQLDMTDRVAVAREINGFVESQTRGKIREIVKADDMSADTIMVLVNALYFDGKWQYPFDKEATHQKSFFANGHERTNVDFMMQITTFNYTESSRLRAKFLEIPYAGEDFTMTLVLPYEKTGLPDLERNVFEVLQTRLPEAHETTVFLPKFKIEDQQNLNGPLQRMGMEAVFRRANLVGISRNRLQVSKVVQKTYIDVNEEGTEAAAATGISIEDRFGNDDRKVFYADHPFLFVIRQRSTGVIHFLGRYTGPE